MTEYHCLCDPHGDNARCDRPCTKPRHVVEAETRAMIAALKDRRALADKDPTYGH
jgi:hypothetical protein